MYMYVHINFLSGLSCIALWGLMKKKPLVRRPHALQDSKTEEGGSVGDGWVTTVAAYPNSDLVASGTCT